MKFIAIWQHWDGSVVEFSKNGWRSTDPEKTDWLTKVSDLSSTAPSIPPLIRTWLEENCELIGFQAPPDAACDKRGFQLLESDSEQVKAQGPVPDQRGRQVLPNLLKRFVKQTHLLFVNAIQKAGRTLFSLAIYRKQ